MILNRFRNFDLLPALNGIGENIDKQNWGKVKNYAQVLKQSSATIGAGVMHYDCYFIQDSYMKREEEKITDRYNRLIENAIEFIQFSEKHLKNNTTEANMVEVTEINYK